MVGCGYQSNVGSSGISKKALSRLTDFIGYAEGTCLVQSEEARTVASISNTRVLPRTLCIAVTALPLSDPQTACEKYKLKR